jgi:hypothetical protein
MSTPEQRFWSKFTASSSDACWPWHEPAVNKVNGYGYLHIGRENGVHRRALAHRFAYEMIVGPIPDGLHIDHLCRNRACVNPAHMEPVTQRENTLRGIAVSATNARKTHCSAGHEFTSENTRTRSDNGGRRCRTCARNQSSSRVATCDDCAAPVTRGAHRCGPCHRANIAKPRRSAA